MSNSAEVEKDFITNGNTGEGNHLTGTTDPDTALKRIQTSGSITITPELFEQIYLSPQNRVKGDLRKTFANPTPICLIGFLMSLTPLSCDLLGWRGAGGSGGGAAGIGAYYGFGAILMILGSLLEWVLGNTFPAVVFASFGAFWFTFGSTLVSSFDAYSSYPDGGINSPHFAASFAFFHLWMGVLCFIYLVCALRTNLTFIVIFFTLVCAFACLAGEYWHLSAGDSAGGAKLQTAAGSFTFVTCIAGWYIFLVQMLASVDFPVIPPLGDLSTVVKGRTERMKQQ